MSDNERQAHSDEAAAVASHGPMYDVFIAALTIVSLAIMVTLLLPVSDAVSTALFFVDTIICFIFLADFFSSLQRASQKGAYFWSGGGWLVDHQWPRRPLP